MYESNVLKVHCSLMAVKNGEKLYGTASIKGEIKVPKPASVHGLVRLFEADIQRKLIFPDRNTFFYGTLDELAKFYYGRVTINPEDYTDKKFYRGEHHLNNFGYLLVPLDDMGLSHGMKTAALEIGRQIPEHLPVWVSGMKLTKITNTNRKLKVAKIPKILRDTIQENKEYYHSSYQGREAQMTKDSELSDFILADNPLGILPQPLIEAVLPVKGELIRDRKSSISIGMP